MKACGVMASLPQLSQTALAVADQRTDQLRLLYHHDRKAAKACLVGVYHVMAGSPVRFMPEADRLSCPKQEHAWTLLPGTSNAISIGH